MAPIRRYLRITKYSVLEVRIYLDTPAHTDSWLLRRNDPALPRIIEAVRPLVLPKLREENERAQGKGKGKKKGVKDVIAGEDFEVSIFLTELSSRHTLLTKQKTFGQKPRIQSNSGKLTGWLQPGTSDKPHIIAEDDAAGTTIREEQVDEPINLDDIPDAQDAQGIESRRSKRRSKRGQDDDALFVGEASASDSDDAMETMPDTSKRKKKAKSSDNTTGDVEMAEDEKKKLAMNTSYDGFSIYGRILCLVVKRKGVKTTASGAAAPASSQAMLENWVSTQAAQGQEDDEDDDG